MSVLAWLMLVVTSAAAAPMEMHVQGVSPVHAASSVAGDRCNHDRLAMDASANTRHLAGCCGNQGMPSCHCAAMCASAVPATLAMIAGVPVSTRYDVPPRSIAPSPNTAPPLRPPSV